MAYQPFDRNPSGIVFFGTSASDQLYESNSNFTWDGSNGALKIPDNGYIGSQTDFDAIQITTNGDVVFSQDINVAGNLTVNGTTTYLNTETVTLEDPILVLGSVSGNAAPSDDNKDRGVQFNWHNGSSAKTGFFGFDDSVGKFTFVPDATIAGEVVSGAAGVIVADLEGDVTGDLTGNADTATTWSSDLTINLGDELSGSVTFNGDEGSVTLDASLTSASITGLAAAADSQDADLLMIYDNSASALRKITRSNFVADLGIMDNFLVAGDAGSSQTISDGNTLTIAGGSGLLTTASATDTLTVDVKTTNGIEISSDAVGLASSVAGTGLNYAAGVLNIGTGTGLTANATTVSLANTSVSANSYGSASSVATFTVDAQGRLTAAASTPISITASQVSDFNTASESAVFTSANFVDGTTIDFTVTAGASVTAEVKDSSITEAKRSRTVDTVSLASSTGVADITLLNATSNNVDLLLPENGGSIGEGRIMTVKRIDNSANTVTISKIGSDTIDGATSVQLYHRYETMTFVSDGSNWYII
jgi:hypothetical protein